MKNDPDLPVPSPALKHCLAFKIGQRDSAIFSGLLPSFAISSRNYSVQYD